MLPKVEKRNMEESYTRDLGDSTVTGNSTVMGDSLDILWVGPTAPTAAAVAITLLAPTAVNADRNIASVGILGGLGHRVTRTPVEERVE